MMLTLFNNAMTTEQNQAKVNSLVNSFVTKYFHNKTAGELIQTIEETQPEILVWKYNGKKICESDGWKAVRVPNKGLILFQEETGTVYKPLRGEGGGHKESTWDYTAKEYTPLEFLGESFFVEDDEDGEIEVELWEELFDTCVENQDFYCEYHLVADHVKELLREKEQPTVYYARQFQHIWRRIVFHHNILPVQQDPVILEIVKEYYNL